jgi:hypothetical protein
MYVYMCRKEACIHADKVGSCSYDVAIMDEDFGHAILPFPKVKWPKTGQNELKIRRNGQTTLVWSNRHSDRPNGIQKLRMYDRYLLLM